jgi:phosphoglycerol transferase
MFLNHQSSNLIQKFKTNKLLSKVFNIFLVILTSIIIIDLIPRPCVKCSSSISIKFQEKHEFFNKVENHLSPNDSVYQMPYMQYPEVPPKNNIKDYELFDGFLHTKNIKWSYGTIKNTQADILMMEISQLPLEKKIQFLKKIGFDGIYYNANGYVNDDVYNNLEGLLGKPIFVNKSLGLFFFDLGKNNDFIFSKNILKELLSDFKK